MSKRMNEFLNSEEYKAFQQSFWKLFFKKVNEPLDGDHEEELIREFEINHLFSSIRLASTYPKEKD